MAEPPATPPSEDLGGDLPRTPATHIPPEPALVTLGWPYVAVPEVVLGTVPVYPSDAGPKHSGHPLARRVIGCFGLVLGGSAGLCVGGLGAALLVALLHPFMPHLANLLLLSLTLFSVAFGATLGRRVLERETFE
ncbi:hypothetical protein DB30_06023 [Enhygromyxa salina]|uniref:Uncharacterized protein n=1 Tax=Enhygromyxa salina TaxID=215803 RepID=A0A0C2CZS5_9BACT|nr:hypothetical protein [Enhygromyxa salina]KIG15115.1 hypothetical protein DB30_06023 [Enhygromyxa salina]